MLNTESHGLLFMIISTFYSQVLLKQIEYKFSTYRIVGKFGKFGESSLIRQTKIIQISSYNYNLLAKSIYLPNFFSSNVQNE